MHTHLHLDMRMRMHTHTHQHTRTHTHVHLPLGTSAPPTRRLCNEHLPHAASWTEVLRLAREDGGMDIKDDCRLDDSSARCHQDGSNAVAKGYVPLVRLAVNVSSAHSGRSLDYLQARVHLLCSV